MPTLTPQRIPAKSPRVAALCRWFGDMNQHVLGITTAEHPRFPLIAGSARRPARIVHIRPMGGAA